MPRSDPARRPLTRGRARRGPADSDPTTPVLGLAAGERWVLEQVRRHGVTAFIAMMTLAAVAGSVLAVTASMLVFDGAADRGTWARSVAFAILVPVLVGPPTLLLSARLVAHLDTATRLLQASAVTDPLTGVANRRGFFTVLDAIEPTCDVEVAMVDIDDFKAINDERGHATGDTALCMVSAWLEQLVGERGTVGRLGGDEFAFVAAADPRRPTPSRMDFRVDATTFSVSIGTARTCSGDLLGALDAADTDLYRLKSSRPFAPRRIVRSDQRDGPEE